MKELAHAKINLCLDVVKKREDGYHEMEMIMVPLSLHDTIWVETSDQTTYVCQQNAMVIDEHNTIVKAVELMRAAFHIETPLSVTLDKQIPMEAGLAGGSADAAAVMRVMWRMFEVPCTLAQLAELGKQIGADVPFCIMNTCALVQGIGERITPFTSKCRFHVLLVKPQQGVSTGKAFHMLNFQECTHPSTLSCMEALVAGDVKQFYHHAGNTLEYSAFQLVPELITLKQELYAQGFPFVLMSGSGSTMFALSERLDVIESAKQYFQERYPFVMATEIV